MVTLLWYPEAKEKSVSLLLPQSPSPQAKKRLNHVVEPTLI